jgi:hypothetical protein
MRPVGEAYKRLVAQWADSLDGERIFLDLNLARAS